MTSDAFKERLTGFAEVACSAVGRRVTARYFGAVPDGVRAMLALTGGVRKVTTADEPVDLAVVQLDGADLRRVAYLSRMAVLLFDPRALAPVEAVRRVREAWAGCSAWVLPLDGPGALSEGIIYAAHDLSSDAPRFSASMPVNLEENDVERVLASFLPVVQEWVVGVDEKSTDGTLAIVQRYAEVCFRFKIEPWSFAEARNRGMNKCSSPWIFETEGHEHLDHESIGTLMQIGRVRMPIGVVMVERDTGGGNPNGGESFYFPWISRNHPALRYSDTGGVHNALEMEAYTAAVGAKESIALRLSRVLRTIHKPHPTNRVHRDAQRTAMNRAALDAYVEDGQGKRTPRALFYAAQEHASAGNVREAVRRAVAYCKSGDTFLEQLYEGHFRLGEYLIALKHPKLASWVLRRALPLDVHRVEALVALADCYVMLNELESARQTYAMAAGVPQPTYANLFVRKAYYRSLPWRGLASVCYQLGQLGDSLNAARCCLNFDPADPVATKIVENLEAQQRAA